MTARSLLRTPATVVWLVLIAATLTSWWLGTDHGIDNDTATGVVILVIAFTKLRLVGLYFMELRHAPLPLRLIFEGWCAVVCATVIVMYLTGA